MTNAIKVLLQMQNGFLQLESTLYSAFFLTLAIGIYMLKSLGSVTELFSTNF
jgi:hypothetical protein